MASYLYKTIIYKDTSNVVGLDEAQNATDKTDFESNKSSAVKVSGVSLASTTFEVIESYTDFKARIVSPLTWGDVKYTENGNYILHLLT